MIENQPFIHIRPETCLMLEEGRINAKEAMLLSISDSLMNNGYGCQATNGYLAKRLNTDPRSIRRMIQKLKSEGLIEQIGFDGKRRHLKTNIPHFREDKNIHPERTKMSTLRGQKCPPSLPIGKKSKKQSRKKPPLTPPASGEEGEQFFFRSEREENK